MPSEKTVAAILADQAPKAPMCDLISAILRDDITREHLEMAHELADSRIPTLRHEDDLTVFAMLCDEVCDDQEVIRLLDKAKEEVDRDRVSARQMQR